MPRKCCRLRGRAGVYLRKAWRASRENRFACNKREARVPSVKRPRRIDQVRERTRRRAIKHFSRWASTAHGTNFLFFLDDTKLRTQSWSFRNTNRFFITYLFVFFHSIVLNFTGAKRVCHAITKLDRIIKRLSMRLPFVARRNIRLGSVANFYFIDK